MMRLLDSTDTPNFVSVYQHEHYVYPLSGCCEDNLLSDGDADPVCCARCDAEFKIPPGVMLSMETTYFGVDDIAAVVCIWTGLSRHQFNIEIG